MTDELLDLVQVAMRDGWGAGNILHEVESLAAALNNGDKPPSGYGPHEIRTVLRFLRETFG